jgi:hypothetical protein
MIKVVDTDIDIQRLSAEMHDVISENNLHHLPQISLTSISGDNDWECSAGSLMDLPNPEKYYCVINNALTGTYIAELLQRYHRFYRWRLLIRHPGTTYTVHTDNVNIDTVNKRLHIPVITNDQSYFCFYDQKPADGVITKVKHHHMTPGKVYEVNTSLFHTAVNYGKTSRYHIVGVTYE